MCTAPDPSAASSRRPVCAPAAAPPQPLGRLSPTAIISIFAQSGHDLVVNRLSPAIGSVDRRHLMAVGSWHLLLPGLSLADEAHPTTDSTAPSIRSRLMAHAARAFGRAPDLIMDDLAIYGLSWRGASCAYSVQTDPWLLRGQRHDLSVPTGMPPADLRALVAELAERLVAAPARRDGVAGSHLTQARVRYCC